MNRLVLASLLVASACGGTAKSTASSSATPAATTCPASVTATVARTYPDGTLGDCHSEHEDGKDFYEVAVTTPDGAAIEVELSTAGVITQTEQVVAAMPEPVATAFAAKYPGATPSRVERHTHPGKADTFEVRFGGREATFTASGDFVEEEASDGDKD